MITLFNRSFDSKMHVKKACCQLKGIGKSMAQQILDEVGISFNVKLENLSRQKLNKLSLKIYQNYLIQDNLRSSVKNNIARLNRISCYRGYRHSQGLPCRGQRTHGNARTSRKTRA